MRRQIHTPKSTRRIGATAVEFVIVAPLFFLLLLGSIEFAVVGTIRSTAHNAAYECARLLVVPGADVQAGIDEARRIMGVVGVDTLDVDVTPAAITVDTTEVRVNIDIPYASNAVFTPWFVGDIHITSESTLITERSAQ